MQSPGTPHHSTTSIPHPQACFVRGDSPAISPRGSPRALPWRCREFPARSPTAFEVFLEIRWQLAPGPTGDESSGPRYRRRRTRGEPTEEGNLLPRNMSLSDSRERGSRSWRSPTPSPPLSDGQVTQQDCEGLAGVRMASLLVALERTLATLWLDDEQNSRV